MSTGAGNQWLTSGSEWQNDAIRIAGLRVDYGDFTALHDLHLHVPRGEIFGLLGPNGAGKTSTFRVLATLQRPTHGTVHILDHDLATELPEIRSRIAYMPDHAPLPSDLRAVEYLRFFAESHGLRGAERDRRVAEVLESVDLVPRSKDMCPKLSLGMRQRLALARCLLHRPGLLILDEPASGLDPLARVNLREALKQQADLGNTVVLSSHVLAELSDLCTSIGLVRQGRLMDAGPLGDVLARHGEGRRKLVARVPGSAGRVAEWLRTTFASECKLEATTADEVSFTIEGTESAQEVWFQRLAEARMGVTSLRADSVSIEEIIVQLCREEGRKG